jgi:tetratricopeptide (TPR) repeat protein
MPVETTTVDDGFTKAWQIAAVEWREASARGTAGFFTSKEAWQRYLPAGFFGVASAVPPFKDQVLALLDAEIDAFRAVVLGPKETELLAALAKAPSLAQENQLGILYAQFGLLAKALERFEKIATAGKYVPAMINAANVYGLKKDYTKAQEYLKRAEKLQPDNTRVLIALAYSYFQAGNQTDAKEAYQRMSKIDPGLASRYPLFGAPAATAGQGRAARADKAMELFGTDWTQ